MRKASHVSLLLALTGFLLAAVVTQLLARRIHARQQRPHFPSAMQTMRQPTTVLSR